MKTAVYLIPLLMVVNACSCSSPSGGGPTGSSSSSSGGSGVMVSFVLPFDDTSAGVTNLSHLNPVPAGQLGRVTVNDQGHFEVGNARIRFWGVNINDRSAFPSHENAEKVAGRLAKFGVNIVRFHHIDNGWGSASVIDYASGNSRSLNADTLDRLDYFIHQLKSHGIYINLNLLNSRHFQVTDGLPEVIKALSWKESHAVGFVYEPVRALEKEYAQQLLNHVNPYTQLSYAEDPAVVMVEINNENGIFQQYYDGALDRWPTEFRAPLEQSWNQWLGARYTTSAEAEAAWGAIDEPLGIELLSNPDFTNGIRSWNVEQHGGVAVTTETGTYENRHALSWSVTTAGSEGWQAQLNQGSLALAENQIYTLGIWARAASSVNLSVTIQQNYDPWNILESRQFALTSQWQYIETQFISTTSDNNLRLNFNGFGHRETSVYLAEVTLKPGGATGKLADGESVEAGTVGGNVRSQGYPLGRERDWATFLRELETTYWTDMQHHLKTHIEYQGLVTGTAIMNSPPSAQAQFDFADGHAYWEHPVFPGDDWDPVNWRVDNRSMVNHLNNTISNLAKQRVAGMPFTVTEYQHSSPNTYDSEAPILAAAYAALQDWDGLMMFAYDAFIDDQWDLGYVNNYFSMTAHPTKMANMLIAAHLFRRGDVAPAEQQILMNFDRQTELNILASQGSSWNVANGSHLGIPNATTLQHRVALDVGVRPAGRDTPPTAPTDSLYSSDTGQLRWDLRATEKGLVTVDTAHTKALVGFIHGREVQLGGVRIAVGSTIQDWATIALTTRSGSFDQPQAPASILLVTTGLMANTGMQWTDASRTSVGNQWGRAPTLVEVIPVTIDLPYPAEQTRVWTLNEAGQRLRELEVIEYQEQARLVLDGTTETLWYEIAVGLSP